MPFWALITKRTLINERKSEAGKQNNQRVLTVKPRGEGMRTLHLYLAVKVRAHLLRIIPAGKGLFTMIEEN